MKMEVIDIANAFLNVDVADNSYTLVEMDKQLTAFIVKRHPKYLKFVDDEGRLTCELEKSLYGTVAAGRSLWRELSKNIIKLGYTMCERDNCIFHKGTGDNVVYLSVFVDDIGIYSKSQKNIDEFVKEFKKLYPNGITHTKSNILDYLGFRVDLSIKKQVTLSMPKYCRKIGELLQQATAHTRKKDEEFNIKTYDSPASTDAFNVEEDSELLGEIDAKNFHSIVATMMYLAKRTKPEILTITSFLAGRVSKCTIQDWQKMVRIVGYIVKTQDDSLILAPKHLIPEVYCDASHACHVDGRGQSGIIYTIGGSLFCAKSSKQVFVALSSTEAEAMALSFATPLIIWAREFMKELGITIDKPSFLYEDNQAVIHLIKRGSPTSHKSRHFRTRFFHTKQLEDRGIITVAKIDTDINISDILTKCLDRKKFQTLAKLMLNSYSYSDENDLYFQTWKTINSNKRKREGDSR
jgi:hypothetical protein